MNAIIRIIKIIHIVRKTKIAILANFHKSMFHFIHRLSTTKITVKLIYRKCRKISSN